MIKSFLLIIFVSILSASHLLARIGENQKEIIERYGEPKEIKEYHDRYKDMVFTVSNYRILVTFMDGISHGEFYIKMNGEDFSEIEISRLLKNNSNGKEWERSSYKKIKLFDQGGKISGSSTGNKFLISTKELDDFKKSLKAEIEEKNLESF